MAFASYTVACATECSGGLQAIYVAKAAFIDQTTGYRNSGFATGTQGVFTGVTMAGSTPNTFYQFGFQDFTAEFRVPTFTPNANGCGGTYTHEVELTFPCINAASRNALEDLVGGNCCGMCIITVDKNGTQLASGFAPGEMYKVTATNITTGKQLTEGQTVTVTLTATMKDLFYIYTGVIPV